MRSRRPAEAITRTDTAIDITLRPGLRFSDGTPATADDVVRPLKAAYVTAQGGVGDGLRLDGAEMQARAEPPTRAALTLPGPWVMADRLLQGCHLTARGDRAGAGRQHLCRLRARPPPPPGAGAVCGRAGQPGERVVPNATRTTGATTRPARSCGTWTARAGDRPSENESRRGQAGRPTRRSPSCARKTSARCGPTCTPAASSSSTRPRPPLPHAVVQPGARAHRLRKGVPARGRVPAGGVAGRRSHRLCQHGVLGAGMPLSEPSRRPTRRGRRSTCQGRRSTPRRRRCCSTACKPRDRNNDGLREDAAGHPVRFAVLVQSGITAV